LSGDGFGYKMMNYREAPSCYQTNPALFVPAASRNWKYQFAKRASKYCCIYFS